MQDAIRRERVLTFFLWVAVSSTMSATVSYMARGQGALDKTFGVRTHIAAARPEVGGTRGGLETHLQTKTAFQTIQHARAEEWRQLVRAVCSLVACVAVVSALILGAFVYIVRAGFNTPFVQFSPRAFGTPALICDAPCDGRSLHPRLVLRQIVRRVLYKIGYP